MTARVVVEQLLIGWSRTSNGKNVLARSPGWPAGSRQEWLTALGDFLDPAIDRVVRETGEAPWLVEYQPSRHGSILMAKAYATESLRAGEFQVHALLDPSGTLGPEHLAGLVDAGVLLLDRPDDVTRLESVTVSVPTAPPGEVRLLARALHVLHRGEPLVLRADTVTEAAALLSSLTAALPPTIIDERSARSVVTDAGHVPGVGIAVAPWSRGASAAPLPADIEVAGYVEVAERILAGDLEVPPVGVPDWLDLALLDPADMTGDRLARGLAGPQAAAWFTAALTTAPSRSLLLEALAAGEVPPAAWPTTLDGGLATALGKGVRLQDALARSAPDAVLRTWAHTARVTIQSVALVDRLRRLGLAPEDFRLRAAGTQWSAWTEEAWRQWLASGSELWPKLRPAIEVPEFPAGFARVLDRLPRDAAENAGAQLLRWPIDLVGDLADALVRCRDAPPDLLIQTLDRLPAGEVRSLVQQHWPALGHQLGLPAHVVAALKPNRGWFGWGGSAGG